LTRPQANDAPDDEKSTGASSRKDNGKQKKGRVTRERSAGVVVLRRTPAGEHEVLLLDYGRHWDYPKGHLEKGETDRDAASRELREETGISECELLEGFSREILYHFQSSRKGLVRKEVIFFAGEVAPEVEVRLSHEHVGFAWLNLASAAERLTFANAKAVLSALVSFLEARRD
jgi:8-oxo-dGTP pyrophosphatase MutT (NUDIX family)